MNLEDLFLWLDTYTVQGMISLGCVIGMYLLAQWYVAGRKG